MDLVVDQSPADSSQSSPEALQALRVFTFNDNRQITRHGSPSASLNCSASYSPPSPQQTHSVSSSKHSGRKSRSRGRMDIVPQTFRHVGGIRAVSNKHDVATYEIRLGGRHAMYPTGGIVLGRHIADGVSVAQVEMGSPAESLGINMNDVILSINGVELVNKPHDYVMLLLESSTELTLKIKQRVNGLSQRKQQAVQSSHDGQEDVTSSPSHSSETNFVQDPSSVLAPIEAVPAVPRTSWSGPHVRQLSDEHEPDALDSINTTISSRRRPSRISRGIRRLWSNVRHAIAGIRLFRKASVLQEVSLDVDLASDHVQDNRDSHSFGRARPDSASAQDYISISESDAPSSAWNPPSSAAGSPVRSAWAQDERQRYDADEWQLASRQTELFDTNKDQGVGPQRVPQLENNATDGEDSIQEPVFGTVESATEDDADSALDSLVYESVAVPSPSMSIYDDDAPLESNPLSANVGMYAGSGTNTSDSEVDAVTVANTAMNSVPSFVQSPSPLKYRGQALTRKRSVRFGEPEVFYPSSVARSPLAVSTTPSKAKSYSPSSGPSSRPGLAKTASSRSAAAGSTPHHKRSKARRQLPAPQALSSQPGTGAVEPSTRNELKAKRSQSRRKQLVKIAPTSSATLQSGAAALDDSVAAPDDSAAAAGMVPEHTTTRRSPLGSGPSGSPDLAKLEAEAGLLSSGDSSDEDAPEAQLSAQQSRRELEPSSHPQRKPNDLPKMAPPSTLALATAVQHVLAAEDTHGGSFVTATQQVEERVGMQDSRPQLYTDHGDISGHSKTTDALVKELWPASKPASHDQSMGDGLTLSMKRRQAQTRIAVDETAMRGQVQETKPSSSPYETVGLDNNGSTSGLIETVTLQKDNAGFGMDITGGADTRLGGLFVSGLMPGGKAARCGQLSIGDRVLDIDGVSTRFMTQADLRTAIASLAPGPVTFTIMKIDDTQWKTLCEKHGLDTQKLKRVPVRTLDDSPFRHGIAQNTAEEEGTSTASQSQSSKMTHTFGDKHGPISNGSAATAAFQGQPRQHQQAWPHIVGRVAQAGPHHDWHIPVSDVSEMNLKDSTGQATLDGLERYHQAPRNGSLQDLQGVPPRLLQATNASPGSAPALLVTAKGSVRNEAVTNRSGSPSRLRSQYFTHKRGPRSEANGVSYANHQRHRPYAVTTQQPSRLYHASPLHGQHGYSPRHPSTRTLHPGVSATRHTLTISSHNHQRR